MNFRASRFGHFVLLALVLILVGCGRKGSFSPTSDSRGVADAGNLFPEVVLVLFPNGICSGGIVSEHAVITAAHCMEDSSVASDYSIIVNGTRYDADDISSTGCALVGCTNDMGVLFFNSQIAVSGVDRIIPLTSKLTLGQRITIVGYGTNNNAARTGAGFKRYGYNVVAYLGAFMEMYSNLSACAGYGVTCSMTDASSGFGDSGAIEMDDAGNGVAIVHAGGVSSPYMISQGVRFSTTNLAWVSSQFSSRPQYSSGFTIVP